MEGLRGERGEGRGELGGGRGGGIPVSPALEADASFSCFAFEVALVVS